jgi:hypothetical protein
LERQFEVTAMARVGYKAPVREGKASILVYVDPDVRTAFKVATIENGTTMQEAIGEFVAEYADAVLKRMKRKSS